MVMMLIVIVLIVAVSCVYMYVLTRIGYQLTHFFFVCTLFVLTKDMVSVYECGLKVLLNVNTNCTEKNEVC